MRIISQDETTDIPYENSALSIESIENGYAIYEYLAYNTYLLAKYDSKEKAKRVLDMLHKLYVDRECWNSYFYDYPKIFKFPDNEDVNVE